MVNRVSGTSPDVPSMTVRHEGSKPEGSMQPHINGFECLNEARIFSPVWEIEVCFHGIIERAKSGVKVFVNSS
jgi:hypothetical protein